MRWCTDSNTFSILRISITNSISLTSFTQPHVIKVLSLGVYWFEWKINYLVEILRHYHFSLRNLWATEDERWSVVPKKKTRETVNVVLIHWCTVRFKFKLFCNLSVYFTACERKTTWMNDISERKDLPPNPFELEAAINL